MTSDPRDAPGLCGRRVDRYEIQHWLGGGGFGAVYRATHAITRRAVAFKLLKSSRRQSPAIVERFVREARVASAVGHPGIVQVLDAGETADGVPFVVMELVEGITLADELRAVGRLPLDRALEITHALLDAAGAAHEAGVVHRDIKPANIMLCEGSPRARLLDFGIGKLAVADPQEAQTSTGVGIGTPGYAAPEQFLSARRADARADLYSIACVLYRMLSGRLPFEARSAEEFLMQAVSDPPTPLGDLAPGVPRAIADVVHRALSRDPESRHGDAAALSQALHDAAAGIEPAATVSVRAGSAAKGGRAGSDAETATARAVGRGASVASPRSPVRTEPEAPPLEPGTEIDARGPTPIAPPRRRWIILALVAAAGALAVVLALATSGPRDAPTAAGRDAPPTPPVDLRPAPIVPRVVGPAMGSPAPDASAAAPEASDGPGHRAARRPPPAAAPRPAADAPTDSVGASTGGFATAKVSSIRAPGATRPSLFEGGSSRVRERLGPILPAITACFRRAGFRLEGPATARLATVGFVMQVDSSGGVRGARFDGTCRQCCALRGDPYHVCDAGQTDAVARCIAPLLSPVAFGPAADPEGGTVHVSFRYR